MACELAGSVLHGYLDGELDAARSAEFELHLQSCGDCDETLKRQTSLRAALRMARLREASPPGLRSRILESLAEPKPRPDPSPAWSSVWLAAAAALVLVLFMGWRALFPPEIRPHAGIGVERVLDAHLRSLQPGHLFDVASTDSHTVKPWFDGRLNFAPFVPELSSAGFPLAGGRLDVLNGRVVAALVYGRRKHFINVFVWPVQEGDNQPLGAGATRGYQWIRWRSGGLEYCAISDVAAADLNELSAQFRQ